MIKGSQALAMPINTFWGTWKYHSKATELKKLQQNLPSFQHYLEKQGLNVFIDTSGFFSELKKGIYFEANIPIGYGMGSSGALCAAILHTFGIEKEQHSLIDLKQILSRMERFFHGSSSGMDPLVSYLNHPIHLEENIQKVNLLKENENGEGALFLLDTGVKREASIYINGFLERCTDKIYDKKCQALLVPLVDDAIQTLLEGQWNLLFETFHNLSLYQFRYFDFMILDRFKELWLKGLSSDHYKLKICGAGGGGFLLGISKNYKETQIALEAYQLLPIYRF